MGKKNKQISTQSTEINHTQMSRIFGGVWKSTLRTGNKESVTTEPFQIVALDIAVRIPFWIVFIRFLI